MGHPPAASTALQLNAADSEIRGLSITRFGGMGILVNGDRATIAGNRIGVAPGTGATDLGNASSGILVQSDDVVIDGNVISGNDLDGILFSSGADRAIVRNNIIGLSASGTVAVGNTQEGIQLDTQVGTVIEDNVITANSEGISSYGTLTNSRIQGNKFGTATDGSTIIAGQSQGILLFATAIGNLIGGTAPGDGNTFAGATSSGVRIIASTSTDNAIIGNRIVANGGIGIDLGGVGFTPNDAGDPDSGTNTLLNFPAITSATVSAGTVTVTYDLDVPANAGQYRVEFFANPSGADPSGYGEGEDFVSAVTTAPGTGLTHTFAGSAGDVITATATRIDSALVNGFGSTSEFSAAITATAVGPLDPVVLDDIQKGTAVLNTGSSSVTATIAAVDPTKAFLTYTLRGDDGTPSNITVNGVLTNPTTVTFSRVGTGATVTIEWSIVEFVSGVTVQRGAEFIGSGGPVNVAISPVDRSRSFVLSNVAGEGNTFGEDDFARATLTSSTNLRIDIGSGLGSTVAWQVIQYNDATVQRGTTSLASGDASRSATVAAVDTTTSWLVYSHSTDNGSSSDIGQKLVRGIVTNGTTLTFDRSSTGQAMDVSWELIEFTDATTVQRDNAAFSGAATTVNASITSVDPSRSIGVGGYDLFGGRSAYTSNDNPGVGWFTTRLTTATNLQVRRDAALATADLGWSVIHWPGPAAPIVVNATGNSGDNAPGDGYCWTGASNTAGARACTLRAAIEEANANPYATAIHFGIPATESGHAAGVWTITPTAALPDITDTVSIDGTTQPGWTSTPVIEINGTSAGSGVDGLRILGDGVTIRGLAINRFAADGIELVSGAQGTTIAGNHIGVSPGGGIDRGNGARGIDLGSGSGPTTVGGTATADRNVISGNASDGIVIWNSSGNTIINNYIGTDVTGNASGAGIGNDADGIALGNGSSNNVIGAPGAGNVLSGNGNDGVETGGTGAGNVLQANHIGLGANGITAMPNGRHGIVLYNGANNTVIGGDATLGEGNVISANTQEGIHLNGNLNVATTANVIRGNRIGTDASGLIDRGNGTYGITVFNGTSATDIGGPAAGHGNVISGNGTDGIYLDGAGTVGTTIRSNMIGVGSDGLTSIPNGDRGVQIESGANGTIVGTVGAGNVIAANANDGIIIGDGSNPGTGTTGTVVEANMIGVGVDGTTPRGNGTNGVRVTTEDDHRIGGTAAGAGNVIAHNTGRGVAIQNSTATRNAILGNSIYSNGEIGIDLNLNGVTLNDPGDVDGGANDSLNFPVITSAETSGIIVTLNGTFDVPAGSYRFEIFRNPSGADPTGYGEGQELVGTSTLSHSGAGPQGWGGAFVGSVGDTVTVTVTEDLGGGVYGSTSEFSLARVATAPNSPPTADAGGPYTIAEGAALVLDASGSTDPDGDPLTYLWDIDFDGSYDDATGSAPTVAWSTLASLGIADDGAYTVGLRVTDGNGGADTTTTALTVTNTAPTPTVSGSGLARPGASYTVNLGVSDPGDDTVTEWRIDWGDGTFETIAGNPSSASHIYAATRDYPITVAVVDEDGVFGASNLLAADFGADVVRELDGVSGDSVRVFPTNAGLDGATHALVGPDGLLYVSGFISDRVVRYDPATGAFVDTFVAAASGGLDGATGLAFAPDGSLLVSSYNTDTIERYDAATGAPLGDFAGPASGLDGPMGMTYGPDGLLYVANWFGDVLRFEADGTLVDAFATANLDMATDLVFGPDGDLYVANRNGAGAVRRYDGTTGAYEADVVTLSGAYGLVFGADGLMYVGSELGDHIRVYDLTGTLVRTHSDAADGLAQIWMLEFVPGHQVRVESLLVNSTGDDGDTAPGDGTCSTGGVNSEGDPECTLRAAIEEANAFAGLDAIGFAIPTSDPGYSASPLSYRLTPASPYPFITDPVTIDASTQPGWSGAPIVELIGTGATGASGGLVLRTDDSLIRGFIVHSFPDEGLEIDGSTGYGDRNTLTNNWVGFDAKLSPRPNADMGILVSVDAADNTIGGTGLDDANVVGYGAASGIVIRNSGSTGNVVIGNRIGVGPDATTPMPNTGAGVEITLAAGSNRIGGVDPGEANIIASNTGDGVMLTATAGSDNAILGNEIRVNGGLGVDLGGDGVTPNDAGDPDAGPNDLLNAPVITSASVSGPIVILNGTFDVPAGSYRFEFFTNPDGADPSGFGEGAQFGATATLSHSGSGPQAWGAAFVGVPTDVVSVTVTEDLGGGAYGSTSEFSAAVTAGTVVVNSTGDAADANPGDHVCNTGATNAEGDTECTLRAAIAEANASSIVDTVHFLVPVTDAGHTAGVWTITPGSALPTITTTTTLDATTQPGWSTTPVIELVGSTAGGNGLTVTAGGTTIRGFAINRFATGIAVLGGTGTTIAGNHLGADPAGTVGEVGNTSQGVLVQGATGTVIGGTAVADRNVISGNRLRGVFIDDFSDGAPAISDGTVIMGNSIGVDATGTAALPYDGGGAVQQIGIALWDGPDNVIGAPGARSGNVISGNSWYGVYVWGPNATGNIVQNNIIGLDTTATTPVGNGADNAVTRAGVYLDNTLANLIGGDTAAEGNTIAGNDAKGVIITGTSADANAIIGNSITGNAGIGIDLATDGVTPNDPGDADTGPNGLVNFPEIDRVQRVAGNLLVDFTLDVPAGDYRIELFASTTADPSGHGEGEKLLGAATITHTGSGTETFSMSVTSSAAILTLTATEDLGGGSYGASSEFSAAVPSPDLVVVNSTGDAADATVGDGQCDTGATITGGDPECTLRAAVAEANDPSTPVDTIWFAIPTADPGHTAGVWTITPAATALPAIAATVTIDASTQPGWTLDPVIAVDGSSLSGTETGFSVSAGADDTDLGHLAVVGFPNDGMQIDADRVQVHDSFVGVLPDGITPAGNATEGIIVTGDDIEIRDNLIGDHGNAAITLVGTSTGSIVTGNIIGTDRAGTVDLGNLQGIWADTTGNGRVGGVDATDANVIANSGGPGVEIRPSATSVAVLGNEIRDNGALGIDLGGDGVTTNDPGDPDGGANNRLNYPVLVNADATGAVTSIDYSLDVPAGDYRIEFYANPAGADPTGYGEGATLIGATTITHPGTGSLAFTHSVAAAAGTVITATATEALGGGTYGPTSEFSAAVTAADATADPTPRRIDATHRPHARRRRRSNRRTHPHRPPPSPSTGGADRLTGPAFDLTSSELTMSAWVNLTALGTDPRLISRADAGGTPIIELFVDSATDETVATIRLGGSTVEARGGTITTGTWHHTAATWDGTDLALYVDGTEVDRVAATGILDRDLTGPVLVGNRAAGDRGVTGTIDHVVIEHRAATADEIATHVANVDDPASFLSLGGEQSALVAPWTITSTQTRSGGVRARRTRGQRPRRHGLGHRHRTRRTRHGLPQLVVDHLDHTRHLRRHPHRHRPHRPVRNRVVARRLEPRPPHRRHRRPGRSPRRHTRHRTMGPGRDVDRPARQLPRPHRRHRGTRLDTPRRHPHLRIGRPPRRIDPHRREPGTSTTPAAAASSPPNPSPPSAPSTETDPTRETGSGAINGHPSDHPWRHSALGARRGVGVPGGPPVRRPSGRRS